MKMNSEPDVLKAQFWVKTLGRTKEFSFIFIGWSSRFSFDLSIVKPLESCREYNVRDKGDLGEKKEWVERT